MSEIKKSLLNIMWMKKYKILLDYAENQLQLSACIS
jgi:hypothetical protein